MQAAEETRGQNKRRNVLPIPTPWFDEEVAGLRVQARSVITGVGCLCYNEIPYNQKQISSSGTQ